MGAVESLARYLAAPFRTDLEKHRVIFRWVAENISYNAKALQTKNYVVIPGVDPFSPEGVLQVMMASVVPPYRSPMQSTTEKAHLYHPSRRGRASAQPTRGSTRP